MNELLGLLIAFAVWVLVVAPWLDQRIQRARRRRRELDRCGRIDTTPRVPPPPIHFTRDPSPKPRSRT